MKKNILYLLNHKTLTDFEVPILTKIGYGVYIPKIYCSLPIGESINYDNNYIYDNSLHNITSVDKQRLDNTDFLNENIYTDELIQIINNNFDFIFLTLYTTKQMLINLLKKFNGRIYFRFFGREGTLNYISVLNTLYKNVWKHNKIKFIFAYQEIYNYELGFGNHFINNYHIIPVGLPNYIYEKYDNTYDPINNHFVFVCSKINQNDCYTDIYNTFCNKFNKYYFIILGKNNELVKTDPRIKNNLPDDEYYKQMSQSIGMYYHGVEPRHLHYHPIEAIVIGLPVIFHQESLLSSYLPNSPGRCYSYEEIYIKLNMLVSDIKFRNSIIEYQDSIKYDFKINHNLNIFNDILIENETPITCNNDIDESEVKPIIEKIVDNNLIVESPVKPNTSTKILFLSHMGLGDIINTVSIVRYLDTMYDEVHIFVFQKFINNMIDIYGYNKKIKFVPCDNIYYLTWPTRKEIYNNINFDIYEKVYASGEHIRNLYNKHPSLNKLPFNFYDDTNLPYNIFRDFFYIPKTIKSVELYNIIKQASINEYIFMHGSSSTGVHFDYSYIENALQISKNDILIIDPNINQYNVNDKYYNIAQQFINMNILDYIDTITNASKLYLSDSCFSCLAIQLNLKSDHNYIISRSIIDYSYLWTESYGYNQNKYPLQKKFITINKI